MTTPELLSARMAADNIARAADAAYWLDCVGKSGKAYADHHREAAHSEFAKLAAALGYRVEKIQPEAAKEAA